MMKKLIKKCVRYLKTWPLIGRPMRIAAAVVRLPEFGESCTRVVLELNHRQHLVDTEQMPQVLQRLSAMERLEDDHDNLVRSTPVALRQLTRRVRDIDRRANEEAIKVESLRRSLAQEHAQLQSADTLGQHLAQTEARLQRVDDLAQRIEFVRRELLFELRYGRMDANGTDGKAEAKAEILSPEKFAAARANGLRLNIGCGHLALDGYINVDRRALPGVDIVAEASNLPLERGEAGEVFSAHLLEHFPQEQLRRELLPYWVSLLRHGGIFRAVVPDADAMIREYANGNYPYEHLREVTFGAQDYQGDFHYNMFIPEQMKELTREAGLSDFEVVAQGRRNGNCFEMEIKARRE